MPKTSIVIRALNESKHIGNLLDSLKKQSYQDFEVVLVDNGSTDETLEIAKKEGVRLVEIERADFTFGYALNVGCEAAKGEYLVFVSAHVLPNDDKWLERLVQPFKDEKVAMTYGRQIGAESTKFGEKQDFFRIFGKKKQGTNIDTYYSNNANSAIRSKLWQEQKFDEYLFGLEDIDWARGMHERGLRTEYVPNAPIIHIHEEVWPQVYNRYRREAIAAVRIGLPEPPQVGLSFIWITKQFLRDLFVSFPNYSPKRLEEIFRFRYYSFKGSRVGWNQGKSIDFETEKKEFFGEENYAVVIKDKNKAVLEYVPFPELKPKDVVIQIEYVGVCKTDIEVYDGTLGYYSDGVAEYPITPGHEFVGRVVKIGSNNKYQERFNIGDRVVGECILCRDDDGREEVGVINRNGGYAKFVVLPGSGLQKVPESITDPKIAVFAEPLAVVLRAIRRIDYRLKEGSKIAVIGAGQIGNLSVQALTHRGFSVDVFDTDESRLSYLEGIADETSTKLENLARYDIIIEATGNLDVLKKVLRGSTVDATLLLLGFPYGDMEFNFERIVGKEKVVVGSVGAEGDDFPKALELLPELDMSPYLQKILPLSEFQTAWKAQKNNEYFKIILEP